MDPLTIASILSMVAAAVWSVWTWSAEHKEERELLRDQAAALYVNPYMVAIAELLLQLRGILEGNALARARREHPGPHDVASPFAIETLYELGLFFGWASATLRFGPYTRDKVVIDCFRQLVRIFDDRDEFPDETFRFNFPEQMSLATAIMRRVGTRVGAESGHSGFPEFTHPEFAPITVHEFAADLRSAQSVRASLYQSPTIRRIIDAIDGAEEPDRLPGRERLEALRPVLVRLVMHLQRKEGIPLASPESTFPSKTTATASAPPAGKDAKGTTIVTGAPAARAESTGPASAAMPEVLYRMKGRIRLRVPRLREDETYAVGLGARIRKWEDVEEVNVNAPAASLEVRYRPTAQDTEFRERVLEAIASPSSQAHRASAARPRRGAARGRS